MADQSIYELYLGLEREFIELIRPNPFSAAVNLRLERIAQLLELLGNPHRAYPSIHVGGTSGKGSTSAMIAAILTEAGYKTGLHMSPHLQIFNERHQIDANVAATSRLAEIYADIKPAIARVAAENPFGLPSYFEAHVALAFLLFQREAVDAAVIEVGLGGSLDATNVIDAGVAVLTNVGLDHTAILGDTVEKIARDKAGIIKAGQTVISGFRQPTVRRIVAKRCRQKYARLLEFGRDFNVILHDDGTFNVNLPGQSYANLELGLKGDFQRINAACAVAAVHSLPNFSIPEEAMRRGLRQAVIPGRVEIVQQNPLVILDGAHNPEKITVARQAIDQLYGDKRRITLLGLKSDKAAADMLPAVITHTDRLIISQFHLDKSIWEPMEAEKLAHLAADLAPNLRIEVVHDPLEALDYALSLAAADDLVWVTGSFYLLGNVREYWYPSEKLVEQAERGLSSALTL